MAPVLKRFMMLSTDSTSSSGIGVAGGLKSSRPRSVQRLPRLIVDQLRVGLKAA
jgi:hypothetical protein